MPEMIRLLLNQAMQIEQNKHLIAKPYELSRYVYGYKPKTVQTRESEVTINIPQARKVGVDNQFIRINWLIKNKNMTHQGIAKCP